MSIDTTILNLFAALVLIAPPDFDPADSTVRRLRSSEIQLFGRDPCEWTGLHCARLPVYTSDDVDTVVLPGSRYGLADLRTFSRLHNLRHIRSNRSLTEQQYHVLNASVPATVWSSFNVRMNDGTMASFTRRSIAEMIASQYSRSQRITVKLGRSFRDHYLGGLERLIDSGELKIGGSVDFINNPQERKRWLDELQAIDWNVFVQGPPAGKSDPAQVVKYLAGYLTGGPIADRQLIRADENEVSFWARPKRSADHHKHNGMNRAEPYRLSGRQFIERWTMHHIGSGRSPPLGSH